MKWRAVAIATVYMKGSQLNAFIFTLTGKGEKDFPRISVRTPASLAHLLNNTSSIFFYSPLIPKVYVCVSKLSCFFLWIVAAICVRGAQHQVQLHCVSVSVVLNPALSSALSCWIEQSVTDTAGEVAAARRCPHAQRRLWCLALCGYCLFISDFEL